MKTSPLLRLAQLGKENGRENRLATQKEPEPKPAATKAATQEQPQDGMAQFYDCLMRCALQEREEQKLPSNERLDLGGTSTEFLDVLTSMSGGNPAPSAAKPKKKSKKAKATTADPKAPAPVPLSQKMQAQLPPNVVRPPTTYYQTPTTLELQVLLPDEGYKYHAMLEANQIFFLATCQASDLKHQFVLNLSLPYSTLRHYQRGRTVYISVKKTVAMMDPLDFHAYNRFLKPNHDMFAKMDDQVQAQVDNIELNQQAMQAPVVRREEQWMEDEDSPEEDRNMEGIERGDTYNDCED